MPVAFPIYGFHVTKPIVIGSAVIRPRTSDHETAEGWSRDLNTYHLTGMLITETASDDFLFNFEAALSYIERLDVLIGKPLPFVDLDIFPQFEESLRMHKKKNGGGEMIGRDIFFPGSREKFLQLIIPKLNDQEFCESTQFNQLFFKCVEQFRQRKQFVEISYFLLFSGLETFARTVMKDHESTSAADPISKLLKSYDFDVSVNRPADLVRAISTYAHLRNSLFHHNQFSVDVNYNGKIVKLRLFDYLFNITQLTNLVVLKAIEFDDGHINWNSWVDRQPFK